jgi:hypothetical protein
MSAVVSSKWVRRGLVLAVVVGASVALANEASALHRRRVVVTYGPAFVPPVAAGPSSFNPVGFGFGGYSYGGYPYYGYYGFLPGPYEGYAPYAPVGAGPFYGQVAYNAYAAAAATGLDATVAGQAAITPPGYVYDPACLMSPHAYRRYLRRLNRALIHSGYWCGPLGAPGAYGVLFGASPMLDGAMDAESIDGLPDDTTDSVIGIDPAATGGEEVAPPSPLEAAPSEKAPVDDAPRPALEPSF